MNKRTPRILAMLLAVVLIIGMLPMSALAAPEQTTIGTQDVTDLFQYESGGSWHDLNTPQHWDKTTGNVAYCLDHTKDSPPGSEQFTEFNPSAVYSASTLKGIQAILSNGYPVKNGGLSDNAARFATANALRAWLKESAGIGYNFMDISAGRVRPKSGQDAAWNFMLSLLSKAQSGQVGSVGGSVSVNPNPSNWSLVSGQLQTTLSISASGGYSITNQTSGINISGFSGNSGDTLNVTAPLSFIGQTASISFEGPSGEDTAALYWYEPDRGTYQPVVVTEIIPGSTGGNATVTIKGEFYNLTVNKKDSHTGAALDGAVFELRQGGTPVSLTKTGEGKYMIGSGSAQFTTSGGKAVIEYLPAGNYQVVELSAPSAGYVVSGSVQVSLTSQKELTIENKPTELHIQKTDKLTNAAMPHIEFRLKDSSGNTVKLAKVKDGEYKPDASGSDTFKLDTSGQAHIYYLPQAQYSIEELPLEGYADLKPQSVTVGTSPATVKVDNDPLTFRLIKKDSHTGKPMPSVKFSVYDSTGKIIKLSKMSNGAHKPDTNGEDVFITGADGSATIYYLSKGAYTVKEAEPVPAYAVAKDEAVTVTGTSGMSNLVQIGIDNQPLTLEFEKKDALTGEYLDGATFRLLDEQGKAVNLSKEKDGEYRPDDSGNDTFTTKGGKAVIRYLTVQKYTIEEVTAPPAFMPDAPTPFTMTWQNGISNPVKQVMKDEPLTLEFTKLDAFTNQPMDGATFKLVDAKGDTVKLSQYAGKAGYFVVDSKGAETWTTKDGKATIYYLPVGSYKVVEVKPAPAYAPAMDRNASVTLQNGMSNPAKLSMNDEPLMLEVRKVDGTNGQPIGGAVFKLTDEDGAIIKLSPIKDKAGYYRPDANGTETFAVDASGKAKILYLTPQVYKLLEVQPPAGFAPAQNAATITLREMNGMSDPARADVKNTPLEFELYKIDQQTKQALSGVSFRLLNEKGEVVKLLRQNDGSYKPSNKGNDTFTTGGDGKAVIRYISIGKYKIEELECSGYGIAAPQDLEITAANDDEHPAKLTFENIPTQLIAQKQDATNGKALSGAIFRLLDSQGKVIKLAKQQDGSYRPDAKGEDTFSVDTAGKAVITHVPAQTLTIEEVTSPAGYALSKPVTVELTTAHTASAPLTTVIKDNPLALKIFKIHGQTKKPLTGAGFAIKAKGALDKPLTFTLSEGIYRYDPAGKETTIRVNDNGEALVYGLPAADYVLEETVIPQNFFPAAPVNFSVKIENTIEKPLEVKVVNEPFVKLGLDTDKYNVVIAIVLCLAGVGLTAWMIVRKRRKESSNGA